MRANWLLSMLLVVFLCVTACADYSGELLGGNGQLAARLGLSRGDRTTVGIEASWLDEFELTDGVGLQAYVTWDLFHDVNLPVVIPFDWASIDVPVSAYIGGKTGVLAQSLHPLRADPTASVLVGLRLGDRGDPGLGIEYQAALTDDLWQVLANTDRHQLLLFVRYPFP